jgi:hypothetical protein
MGCLAKSSMYIASVLHGSVAMLCYQLGRTPYACSTNEIVLVDVLGTGSSETFQRLAQTSSKIGVHP